MATNPLLTTYDSLPQTLPIFPLSGVVLLPNTQLPLNIFEPRYLNMVTDALGTGRLLGILQPNVDDQSGLSAVGCAGRIIAFRETPDGRLLISIQGVCRFDVGEEVATIRGYRRVMADWSRFSDDFAAPSTFDTARLLFAMRPYFEANGIEADPETLRRMPAVELVDFLAVNLPFSASEKQTLVETLGGAERAHLLEAMATASLMPGESSTRH